MTPSDREAFDRFVATRSQRLLRTAYLLTGDRGHAEDLLQTSLAKLISRWASLREQEAAETYVRRLMITTYGKWWRRRWRCELPFADLPEPPAGDDFTAVETRDQLRRALATLTARQRAIVVLRFYEDLTEAQVAARLGCSIGTVKSTVSRALADLRATGLVTRSEASTA